MINSRAKAILSAKDILLPILCIIDLLMLPYLRFLSCSLSMLLVLFWYFTHLKKIPAKTGLLFIVFSVIFSLLIGFLCYNSLAGISTAVILVFFVFLLYFFDMFFEQKRMRDILSKIFLIYITVVFLFAIIYILRPQLFFDLRSFWSMGNTKIVFSSRRINRFTFIYSDPNNAGCALTGIYAYVLFCEKNKFWKSLYYITALGVSVAMTMSVQAILAFAVVTVVFLFVSDKDFAPAKKALLYLLCAAAIVAVVLGSFLLRDGNVVSSLMHRLTHSNFGSAGGRMDYWTATIENALSWYNVVIGKGAVIDASGQTYLPHSGILYMTVSFGLLSCLAFLGVVFLLPKEARLRYYVILLPFLMIILLNTGIIDYRFMGTLAIVVASVRHQSVPTSVGKCCINVE